VAASSVEDSASWGKEGGKLKEEEKRKGGEQ